ncbi:MAG: TetR/AcrR family transcriptional regulator [Myxococcales bacterium]|nr:TetR/AcrR family transcriptional regulator [Myxococcales bacterium]
MPRPHTPAERERIRARLLEVGRDSFARAGLAKVSIAELARSAGIGKGSFYQFFESKEELFFAVHEHEEETFKAALARELEQAPSKRDAVRSLLLASATRLDEHPFLRQLLDPVTIRALTLRVAPERVAAPSLGSALIAQPRLRQWQRRGWLRPELDVETAVDVLTAMFVITLQRELVGAEATLRALDELAESVAARWCTP